MVIIFLEKNTFRFFCRSSLPTLPWRLGIVWSDGVSARGTFTKVFDSSDVQKSVTGPNHLEERK
jgi:hypothetical protein